MTRKAGLGILGAAFLVAMIGFGTAAAGSANPAAGTPAGSTAGDYAALAEAVAALPAETAQDYGPLTEDMVTDEMIATGSGIFNSGSCQRCHMQGGQGSERAPALTDDEWLHSDGDLEGIRATIISGVAEDEFKGGDHPYPMYAMGGMELDEDALNALAAYVWSLSQE
jgi:mono/diheme cytochrome c family protein